MPEQLPFTLKAFRGGSGGWTEAAAVLESPLLDPAMHPGRSVALHATLAKAKKGAKPGLELAPFERASLLAYLREQPGVRRAIEARFAKEGAPATNPWAQARVRHLVLEPLDVPTPDRIKGRRAALFDKPDTRSKFFVVLGVGWDGEHPRTAYFRDGALFEWQLG
jgi:hypothetical protein